MSKPHWVKSTIIAPRSPTCAIFYPTIHQRFLSAVFNIAFKNISLYFRPSSLSIFLNPSKLHCLVSLNNFIISLSLFSNFFCNASSSDLICTDAKILRLYIMVFDVLTRFRVHFAKPFLTYFRLYRRDCNASLPFVKIHHKHFTTCAKIIDVINRHHLMPAFLYNWTSGLLMQTFRK